MTNLSRFSPSHRMLAAACVAFALIQLDVTIVNVALARIGGDLAVPVAGLQWVVDAYTLVFAGLMLPAGSIADHRGPARACFALGGGGFAGLCFIGATSAFVWLVPSLLAIGTGSVRR